MKEIGSEFTKVELNHNRQEEHHYLSKFGEFTLTDSGRSAIYLCVQSLPDNISKHVLLPAYICESVIQPFQNLGYKISFYDIDSKFDPIIPTDLCDVGVIFIISYFGFNQVKGQKELIEYFESNCPVIIEDVTHSMFSNFERDRRVDYYVGSIRKWTGLFSGGFIGSTKHPLPSPTLVNEQFVEMRQKAMNHKKNYFESHNLEEKNLALSLFRDAEGILNQSSMTFSIDAKSASYVHQLSFQMISRARRANFSFLVKNIQTNNHLDIVFPSLDISTVPFFCVLRVREGYDLLQKKLADAKIYAPHHWPTALQINIDDFHYARDNYRQLLSIPCDQRYTSTDMQRIADFINEYTAVNYV